MQGFNSKQLIEPQAKSIPKPIARSASLERFSNKNEIYNNQKSIQILNIKDNLNKALQQKLNPFNNANKNLSQNISQSMKSKDLIVNKLLQKNSKKNQNYPLLQSQSLSKGANIQHNTDCKSNINSIQSFYHKHQNIKKLLTLKDQKQKNQLKECTFNPKTNIRNNNLMEKRTDSNQFYQQQIQFEKKKLDKIQQMRQIIQQNKNKENIFQPQITHRENQRSRGQVYQRLYEQSKTEKQKQNEQKRSLLSQKQMSCRSNSQKRANSTNKIKSIIGRDSSLKNNNIKSFSQMNIKLNNQTQEGKKIVSSRPNSIKKISPFQQEHDKKQENTETNAFKKRIQSYKNLDCQELLHKHHKLEQQKIKQQRKVSIQKDRNQQIIITKLIKEIIQVLIKTNFPYNLNYMELSSFLQILNFIDKNCSANQRVFISQIWNLLNGHTYNFVSVINIIKILCCVQGATKPKIIDQLIQSYFFKSPLEQIKNIIPSRIENILVLQQKDTKIIKQRFQQLNFNRIRLGQSSLTKLIIKEEHSFKPVISQASEQFAQRYRERILKQSQELLNQNKIHFDVPQGGMINHTELLLLDEKRRVQKLKQMREQKIKQEEVLQQHSMIQHQSSMKTQKSQKSKNIQSCSEQLSSILSQRKQNQDSENSQIKCTSYEQSQKYEDKQLISPLLFLNVNMEGNQNTKIPVFKNDTLKTMTQKVRVIMKIQDGQEQRKKLSYILRAQIQPILIKMGLQKSIQIV